MPQPQNRTVDQENLGWWKLNRVFTDADIVNMANAVQEVDGQIYDSNNRIRYMGIARPDLQNRDGEYLENQWSGIYSTPFGFLGIGTIENVDGVKKFRKSIYADFLKIFPKKAYLYFQILFLNYQIPHPNMSTALKNRYKNENLKTKPFILLLKILIQLFDTFGINQTYLTKFEILNYIQYQFFDLTDDTALNNCVNQIIHNRSLTPNPYEVSPDNEEPYYRFVKQLLHAKLFDFNIDRINSNESQIERAKQLLKHQKIIYTEPDSDEWTLNFFKIMTPEKYEIYKVKPLPKIDIAQIPEKIKFISDDNSIINNCITALSMGKSIILYGPPGTGKTTLATQISDLFGCTSERVTASDDWSTYDTIGGLVHKGNEGFKGKDGAIVNAIENCYNSLENRQNGNWLIIDEINRCKIDAALGEMFTCLEAMNFGGLTEDEIEKLWKNYFTLYLSFRDQEELKRLPIPRTFRLIGTLNTYDKHFLYNISYALMRRFSYIYVPVLRNWEKELELIKKIVINSLKEFDYNLDDFDQNDFLFSHLKNFVWLLRGYSGDEQNPNIDQNKIIREIGTAQLIDTMKICMGNIFLFNIKDQDEKLIALDEAISANIIPQLEGLGPKLDEELINNIQEMDFKLATEKLIKMKVDNELF